MEWVLRVMEVITDLRFVKRVLAALCIASALGIAADQLLLGLTTGTVDAKKPMTSGPATFSAQAALEPVEVLQEMVERRNLFDVRVGPDGNLQPKSSIHELTKDLRLKGLAVFEQPEAILEDARTGTAIFVKEGDGVGELQVKKIRPESLILSYRGEDLELRLQGGENS